MIVMASGAPLLTIRMLAMPNDYYTLFYMKKEKEPFEVFVLLKLLHEKPVEVLRKKGVEVIKYIFQLIQRRNLRLKKENIFILLNLKKTLC